MAEAYWTHGPPGRYGEAESFCPVSAYMDHLQGAPAEILQAVEQMGLFIMESADWQRHERHWRAILRRPVM